MIWSKNAWMNWRMLHEFTHSVEKLVIPNQWKRYFKSLAMNIRLCEFLNEYWCKIESVVPFFTVKCYFFMEK